MLDLDNTAELVPVSEWVYNLYKVSYWSADPEQGGRLVSTKHLAATASHIGGEADHEAPNGCEYMTWEPVRENVGHPRVIGNHYGHPLYESGEQHARRLRGL